MFTELADVRRIRRAQIRIGERLAREPVTIVEAAGHGVGAHVRPRSVEHRQLRFLGRAHAAIGIQDDDARAGNLVKRVRDGAAGVARRRRQNGDRLVGLVQRRHQPRHQPGHRRP